MMWGLLFALSLTETVHAAESTHAAHAAEHTALGHLLDHLLHLLKQYEALQQMTKMMSGKNMKKLQKKMGMMGGGFPGMGGGFPGF